MKLNILKSVSSNVLMNPIEKFKLYMCCICGLLYVSGTEMPDLKTVAIQYVLWDNGAYFF